MRVIENRLSRGAGLVALNTAIDYYEATGDSEVVVDVGEYTVTLSVRQRTK